MDNDQNSTDHSEGTRNIIPCPTLKAFRNADGEIVIPLWFLRDGEHVGDDQMVLTLAQAEHLHAALTRALDGGIAAAKLAAMSKAFGFNL